MLNKIIFMVIALYCLGFSHLGPSEASDLRHQFINPNFGGPSFNAQPLMNSAVLQNDFEGSQEDEASALEDFQNRLDRAILNRLSREIVAKAFGEDSDLTAGTFSTGNFEIEITEDVDGVTIGVVDAVTGDTTTVEVPFF